MMIENAVIANTTFGIDDHGNMSFYLSLYLSNNRGQAIGGCCFDTSFSGNDDYSNCFIGKAECVDLIMEILKVVGVKKWEDLKGKYIRVKEREGDYKIEGIGNALENKWFDLSKFFKNDH